VALSVTPCGCNRSLAVLAGLFASLAGCALLAEDRCLDGGGRVSDALWACDLASGTSASLWSLLPPWTYPLVAISVGVPVFLVVNAIGRRFIVACGLPAE
jgi:hypothetical protein